MFESLLQSLKKRGEELAQGVLARMERDYPYFVNKVVPELQEFFSPEHLAELAKHPREKGTIRENREILQRHFQHITEQPEEYILPDYERSKLLKLLKSFVDREVLRYFEDRDLERLRTELKRVVRDRDELENAEFLKKEWPAMVKRAAESFMKDQDRVQKRAQEISKTFQEFFRGRQPSLLDQDMFESYSEQLVELLTETDRPVISPIIQRYLPKDILNLIKTPETEALNPIVRNLVYDPIKAFFGPAFRSLIYEPVKRYVYFPVKGGMRLWYSLYFKMDVDGKDKIPNKGPVVLAINHRSFLDPVAVGMITERKVSMVAAEEFDEVPILRGMMDLVDSISIKRSAHDMEGFARCLQVLLDGHIFGIFPEGTIPGSERRYPKDAVEPETGLLKGHSGAIRLSLLAKCPIVPVGHCGTEKAFPVEAMPLCQEHWIIKPAKIFIRVGEPITYEEYYGCEDDHELLRELTEDLMLRLSEQVQRAEAARKEYYAKKAAREAAKRAASVPETGSEKRSKTAPETETETETEAEVEAEVDAEPEPEAEVEEGAELALWEFEPDEAPAGLETRTGTKLRTKTTIKRNTKTKTKTKKKKGTNKKLGDGPEKRRKTEKGSGPANEKATAAKDD